MEEIEFDNQCSGQKTRVARVKTLFHDSYNCPDIDAFYHRGEAEHNR